MALSPKTKLVLGLLMILEIWASQSLARPSINADAVVVEKHKQWMTRHSRTYQSDAEKQKRFEIFKTNLEYIEKFNNSPNKTYTLRLNEFSDLTNEEFLAAYTGFKMPASNFTVANYTATTMEMQDEVPDSIDWRDKGVVTSVKNQGQCGCCWAFSAVTAIEGLVGNGVSLSAQQLLDCTGDGNSCKGGWMNNAFQSVIQNQGIASESEYPYQGFQGNCDTEKSSNPTAQISSFQNVEQSEQALLYAVANQPVSVTLEATQSFQHYGSGVFSGDDCGGPLNHAVAIIGYGVTEEGKKYWILKNQWGETWGINGYMMMLRDSGIDGGLCGIANHASYPVMDSK